MIGKLGISQLFVPNSRNAHDYVAAYQETLQGDQPTEIFVVLEIRGERKPYSAEKEAQYNQIVKTIAGQLRRSFRGDTRATEAVFEQSLAAVNSTLAELARSGVVGWYKRLSALIAAHSRSHLYVASAGEMSAILIREGKFSRIAEDISPREKPNPLKTFSTFAAGQLEPYDAVVLSCPSLLNYISLEKIRTGLDSRTLTEASRDFVQTLKQDAPSTESFAAFLLHAQPRAGMSDEELQPLMTPASHKIIDDGDNFDTTPKQRAYRIAAYLGHAVWQALRWLVSRIRSAASAALGRLSSRGKPVAARNRELDDESPARTPGSSRRMWYLGVFAFLAILLVANIIFHNVRTSRQQIEGEMKRLLSEASQSVTDARAALIYEDENRARREAAKAKEAVGQVLATEYFRSEAEELDQEIQQILNSLNKITVVETVETLAQFSGTPNRLVGTGGGYLGLNNFTGSIERYADGRLETLTLSSLPPEKLVDGAQLPGNQNPVFISSSGRLWQLGLDSRTFSALTPTSTDSALSAAGLKFYGGRAYSVGTGSGQILRYTQSGGAFGAAQPWLRAAVDFSRARDLAIDGNIYVLLPDQLLKFTQGNPQPFALPELENPLGDMQRIFTAQEYRNIYILDPGNSRIVILDKQGALDKQLILPNLKDLRDMWIDEPAGAAYLLDGNNLVRIKF